MESITSEVLYIKNLFKVIKASNKNHHKTLIVDKRHSDAFVYILSGACTYTFENGRKVRAAAGNVLYLSHNSRYEMFIHDDNYRFIFCDFEFASAARRECEVFSPDTASHIEHLFVKLKNTYQSSSPSSLADSISILYSIYGIVICAQNKGYVEKSLRTRMENAKSYIDIHCSETGLAVSELADMLNISEVYFRKQFKMQYGQTPSQYIISKRLQTAIEYMNYPFLSMEECARHSGFASGQYFSRVFKKHIGTTPAKYRKVKYNLDGTNENKND